MNNTKHEFYESKIALFIFLLFCFFMDIFSFASFYSTCPNNDSVINVNMIIYCLFFLGLTAFVLFKFIGSFQPYIIIDALRLQNRGRSFSWPQIKGVKLTYRSHYSKKASLYLKLELTHQEYWISLQYVSDSVRRKILDAIESHIPVQYVGCKYESNEQTFIMGACLFVFALLLFTFILVGVVYFKESYFGT